MRILFEPVVRLDPPFAQRAIFPFPVALERAFIPIAVFLEPVVTASRLFDQRAVLPVPVVFE
jgi:hypothetical protein